MWSSMHPSPTGLWWQRRLYRWHRWAFFLRYYTYDDLDIIIYWILDNWNTSCFDYADIAKPLLWCKEVTNATGSFSSSDLNYETNFLRSSLFLISVEPRATIWFTYDLHQHNLNRSLVKVLIRVFVVGVGLTVIHIYRFMTVQAKKVPCCYRLMSVSTEIVCFLFDLPTITCLWSTPTTPTKATRLPTTPA